MSRSAVDWIRDDPNLWPLGQGIGEVLRATSPVAPKVGRAPDRSPPAPADWWEAPARKNRARLRSRLAAARIALELDGEDIPDHVTHDAARLRALAEEHRKVCAVCSPPVDTKAIARHRRICPACRNGRPCYDDELTRLTATPKPCAVMTGLRAAATEPIDRRARIETIRRRYLSCEGGAWLTFDGHLCLSFDDDRPLREWRHCGDRLCAACARRRSARNVSRLKGALEAVPSVDKWAPLHVTFTTENRETRTASAAIGLVRRALSKWRRLEQVSTHIKACVATVEVTRSTVASRRRKSEEHLEKCAACQSCDACTVGERLRESARRSGSWWHAHAHAVVVPQACDDDRCLRCAFFGKSRGERGVTEHRAVLDTIVRDGRSKWRAVDVEKARARRRTRRGARLARQGSLPSDEALTATTAALEIARRSSWLDVGFIGEMWDKAVRQVWQKAPADLARLRHALERYASFDIATWCALEAQAQEDGETLRGRMTGGRRLDDLVPIVVEHTTGMGAPSSSAHLERAFTPAGRAALRKGDVKGALVEAVKYCAKPSDVQGLNDDELVELMRAMKGRRMFSVYGITVDLDDEKEEEETERIHETLVRVDRPPFDDGAQVVTIEHTRRSWSLEGRARARVWALLGAADNAARHKQQTESTGENEWRQKKKDRARARAGPSSTLHSSSTTRPVHGRA